MRDRLRQWFETLRASYWFIPSLMSLGALILALVAPQLDVLLGSEWIEAWRVLGPNQPQGARSLLSTVAGSMITVAGVSFSITIAAVAYATAQYGPRLLANFMRDTGNQVTLGVFIATYLYCIIVLRTIREPATAAESAVAFVPHLAILLALIMALLSVGVLIFFFHHVPESIHASNVIGDVGRSLEHMIEKLFTTELGEPASATHMDPQMPPIADPAWRPVELRGGGYLRAVMSDRLLQLAEEHDLVVHLMVQPGAFVADGTEVSRAWPRSRCDDGVVDVIESCFVRGNLRSEQQDITFLMHELVEIAARALSSGVNDPFTAMTCIDWLTNALGIAARGFKPGGLRAAEDGTVRVIVTPTEYPDLAEAALGRLRTYAASDPNAAVHLAERLSGLIRDAPPGEVRHVLEVHAELFMTACDRLLPLPTDAQAVRRRLEAE